MDMNTMSLSSPTLSPTLSPTHSLGQSLPQPPPPPPNPLEAVSLPCRSEVLDPKLGTMRLHAYELEEAIAKSLAAHADVSCYRCGGTGVKKWRRRGTEARTCGCLRRG